MSNPGDDELYDEADGPPSMVIHEAWVEWDADDNGMPVGFHLIEP